MGSNHAKPECYWLKSRNPIWPTDVKLRLYSIEHLKKNLEILPFFVLPVLALSTGVFLLWRTTMRSGIDIQLDDYQRWEIPSKPRFFDLRNPRGLKLLNTHNWEPAIHLDNRYRLMRNEPMLDKDGNETDEIGEDETGWDIPIPE